MFMDEEIFKPKNNIEKILENDNLLKICFDFCEVEDILNLSLVNRKFNKIKKF